MSYFKWSSWLWIYQVEVNNIFLNCQDNWIYPKIKMLENNALNLLLSNLIYFSFLTCFEWSKIKWVHQFELLNLLSTPSAIELCLKILSSNPYFAKSNIYHTKLKIISKPHISFFVHFEQSLPWWARKVKVHNTSFKSKQNQDMSKDFELFENWNVQTPTSLPSFQKLKKKTLLNGLYGIC